MRDVLLTALAAWRLARLLVREDGPFDVLTRVRYAAGVPQVGWPWSPPRPFLSGVLACEWCASVWTALLLWPLRRTAPVRILAVAGAAAVLIVAERQADQRS